ncbi:MAG: hypothetical protein SAL07_25510 [Oscillatoria sp. PMC 1051.18]|nr:hypothetical protein [Oscillatoria sp. PMC 1050.18]MEC5033266.1 hypothetical protein [Oscillatoria sp. PMC 1051.18]
MSDYLVAVIWQKRALPIYWYLLSKKGASNLSEQQAVLKPVIKLLKSYELVIIGDREFTSVKLAYWLKSRNKTQKVFFAFRQKLLTKFKKGRSKYQSFNDLKLIPGVKKFLTGVSVTKSKGFGRFNVLAYQQRKYRTNHQQEPWFILTNLSMDIVMPQ